jgi:type II secretion system protein G
MRQLGFTLLEMTVVLAIMGILASAAVGAYLASQKKGRDAGRKSDLAQLERALEAYTSDHGLYPAAIGSRIASCGAPNYDGACGWGAEFRDKNGTVYMKQLPRDPAAQQIYVYLASTDRKKYQLFALLENQNDPSIANYTYICSTSSVTCNYGVSSSNATPTETLE